MTDVLALPRIAEQLERLHTGDAWHGPSLREALDGVTAEMAVHHVVPNAHTILELTHHVAAWAGEVTQRLQGREPRMPDEGDFPDASPTLTEDEWTAARARLDQAHGRLLEAIQTFDATRLHDVVGSARDAPAGVGVTYYAMLHGLIQHDAYHAGQIMLIKRACL